MSSEEIVDKFIERLFEGKIGKDVLKDKVGVFRKLAIREWTRWISGSYRPSSISEITADRIFQIYSEVMEDIPAVDALVNYFNIPAGRAKYIISALTYGGYPELRRLARIKLKETLEGKIKGRKDEEKVSPFIEKALLDELSIIEYELLHKIKSRDYERYRELPGRRSFGLECEMTVKSAKLVIERLNELLKSSGGTLE